MKKLLLVLALFSFCASPTFANHGFGGHNYGGFGYRPFSYGYSGSNYGNYYYNNPLWCGTNHWRNNFTNSIASWLPYFLSNSYYPTNNYFQVNPYISSPFYLGGIGY